MKELIIYSSNLDTVLKLPYADVGVRAGFPSPAQDYIDKSLDLNRDLIAHPAATFYARVVGVSMIRAGIDEGDILVIDRALDPKHNDIVVAFVNGEFTMKFIDLSDPTGHHIVLRPANPEFQPITITPDDDFTVWGVVSKVIKNLR